MLEILEYNEKMHISQHNHDQNDQFPLDLLELCLDLTNSSLLTKAITSVDNSHVTCVDNSEVTYL